MKQLKKRLRRVPTGHAVKEHLVNRPKPEQLRDAEEREAALLRRTPIEELLGDPPPGYSALDQRGK